MAGEPSSVLAGLVTMDNWICILEPQFPLLVSGSKPLLDPPLPTWGGSWENTEWGTIARACLGPCAVPPDTSHCGHPYGCLPGSRAGHVLVKKRKAELIKSTANSAGYPQE